MYKYRQKNTVPYLADQGEKQGVHIVLFLAVFLLVASIMALAYTPPTAKDALIHHLAIPKLWIEHGGFYDLPFMIHSYYPMNVDLLYIVPLLFKNDIIPNYIHLSFGLLTAFIIYRYLKRRVEKTYALAGVLIFLSTPIIIKLSTAAYVDLGLLFFSSLSLVALLEWQEQNFKIKWFIISAISCGLTMGTKYNGLIVFLLLTLAVPYLYIRRHKDSLKAIRYGFLYALISLTIFSPWMIKNYILTGNPVYPLYDSIFNGTNVNTVGSLGIFQIRELIYGESWWEIMLIPLRIFFTGADGSARQFDGVLTPILLIFLPFSFLNKRGEGKDDIRYLLLFALLYFLIVFFKTDMRIRYILPVLTPLVILTVYGIRNVYYVYGRISKVLCVSVCGLLLALNINYLYQQFKISEPLSYIAGRVSRDQYLGKRLGNYEAFKFINENLPKDVKIMLLFLGNRGYYCDRPYVYDTYYDGMTLKEIIQRSKNAGEIKLALTKTKVTHLLMNNRFTWEFLRNNLDRDKQNLFGRFIQYDARLLFSRNGYSLYELVDKREPVSDR